MSDIDRFLQAATRENTRQSYQSAIRDFEVEWGGFLPATPDSIARYLANRADKHAVNTLRQRLAALAKWHLDQGFPDPTKAPVVRQVLRGIQTLYPAQEKRAKPFQIDQLMLVDRWLTASADAARAQGALGAELRCRRNKALFLLGFWRGFRGDELTRLQIEHVHITPGEGMTCFLPRTKGDRQFKGGNFKVPLLSRLCPVTAYEEWVTAAASPAGPVFRAIDRWGNIRPCIIPLMRLVVLHTTSTAVKILGRHIKTG